MYTFFRGHPIYTVHSCHSRRFCSIKSLWMLEWVDTEPSVNRSVRTLVLCMFLFKDTLFNIVDLWALNPGSTELYHSCLNEAYLPDRHFLRSAHHSLPVPRVQPSALRLRTFFKRRNQQKAQYMKNVALSRPWKGYLFTVWELKQGRGFPYWPQQGDRFTNTKTVNEHCFCHWALCISCGYRDPSCFNTSSKNQRHFT